jgi:hypothetical protein
VRNREEKRKGQLQRKGKVSQVNFQTSKEKSIIPESSRASFGSLADLAALSGFSLYFTSVPLEICNYILPFGSVDELN